MGSAAEQRKVGARLALKESAVSPQYIRRIFFVDPKDPQQNLRWAPGVHRVRRVKPGSVAGCILPKGYRLIGINGVLYQAHRVAFAYHKGRWPTDQIDHINGIRDDNRIENLREVGHLENHRNKKMPTTNTSGLCGVMWIRDRCKWRADIFFSKRKPVYLGTFDNLLDAAAARKSAELKFGFHENHGRKA